MASRKSSQYPPAGPGSGGDYVMNAGNLRGDGVRVVHGDMECESKSGTIPLPPARRSLRFHTNHARFGKHGGAS